MIGLGLPNDNKRYVHDGITDCVVLWNTMDLGYLTVPGGPGLEAGHLEARRHQLTAGRLGTVEIKGDNILLGQPFCLPRTISTSLISEVVAWARESPPSW